MVQKLPAKMIKKDVPPSLYGWAPWMHNLYRVLGGFHLIFAVALFGEHKFWDSAFGAAMGATLLFISWSIKHSERVSRRCRLTNNGRESSSNA